jgi:predicted alpha/beta superfamily hydrolase
MTRVAIGLGALCLAACTTGQTVSQTALPLDHLPALKGDYFRLQSRSTGHPYHVYVRLPDGYDPRAERTYPTVYLLDGDSLFPYLSPHHLFLTYDDKLPEAIIVGIAYGSFAPPTNNRDRDFGDGAPAFQQFLNTELVPAIETRVRADPNRRILVGQSRGGGFVLYSAYTSPDLFWARVASNPSFPAHRDLLLAGNPSPATRSDLRLVVSSGTHDRPPIRKGTLEWFAAQEKQSKPWTLHLVELEGGTHAADMPNAYRRAMRWLFKLGD